MENIFHDVYEKLTTDTRAHADVFNALFDKFLENDKFLKYAADSLAEKMLEKGMIANNLVTDNAEMVLSAPMGKLLKQQLDEQNNNLGVSYTIRNIIDTKKEISELGSYVITKDVPNPGSDYIAVSFGRKGYHWNFPVLLFNNWGDHVPLRMFKMQTSDGVNYSPSEYMQIITNKDMPILETHIVNPNGSNIVTITLKKRTDSGQIFVSNAYINDTDTYILGYHIENDVGTTLKIKLSQSTNTNMRFNVMYKYY